MFAGLHRSFLSHRSCQVEKLYPWTKNALSNPPSLPPLFVPDPHDESELELQLHNVKVYEIPSARHHKVPKYEFCIIDYNLQIDR